MRTPQSHYFEGRSSAVQPLSAGTSTHRASFQSGLTTKGQAQTGEAAGEGQAATEPGGPMSATMTELVIGPAVESLKPAVSCGFCHRLVIAMARFGGPWVRFMVGSFPLVSGFEYPDDVS